MKKLITICFKKKADRRIKSRKTFCRIAVLAILVALLAHSAEGNFTLTDSEYLMVDTSHYSGYLYDTSRADIVSGASVSQLYAYDSSTANVFGGGVGYLRIFESSIANVSGGDFYQILAYDSSTANFSGGSATSLLTNGTSTANFFGGSVTYLTPYSSSTANVFGGSPNYLRIFEYGIANVYGGNFYHIWTIDSSTANVSGGSANELVTHNSSTTNISGGSVSQLYACDSSTVRFYGQDFSLGSGLSLDGTINGWWRLSGTGALSGKWMNGTPWTTNIMKNSSTILLIPEPATLLLLGLGGFMLRKRRA